MEEVRTPAPPSSKTEEVLPPRPPPGPPGPRGNIASHPQALALLLRESGAGAASSSTTGSTKSKRRTRQLLRNVSELQTMEDLINKEHELRQLVQHNEVRRRENWNLQRLQGIQFAEMREDLREAETAGRDDIDAKEARTFTEELGYHAIIVGEDVERRRLASQYPPQVLKTLHLDLLAGALFANEQGCRLEYLIPTEAIEREHVVSRAWSEERCWQDLAAAIRRVRVEANTERVHLAALQEDRLVLERAEITARGTLEADALQSLAMLVSDALIDRRYRDWWNVEGHETKGRHRIEAEAYEGFEQIRAKERRAMGYRLAAESRARAIQQEGLYREDIEAEERRVWNARYLEALRQWQVLYDATTELRGPRVEVEHAETFRRRDIEATFFAERAEMSAFEQKRYWGVRRRDAERHDFYDYFLDGHIALLRVEEREREGLESQLRLAIDDLHRNAAVQRLEALETGGRDDVVYEQWNAYLWFYLEARRAQVVMDHEAASNATRLAELLERQTLERRLEHLLSVETGAGGLEECVMAAADAYTLIVAEEEETRLTLEEGFVEGADDIEENAALDTTADGKAPLQRLLEREARTRGAVLDHEEGGREAIEIESLINEESIARWRIIGVFKSERSDAKQPSADDGAAIASAATVDAPFDSERGARAVLYALATETVETMIRWEYEWEAGFILWDATELECVDFETVKRHEWEESEATRRELIYDMRNAPLPKNVWVGALEGDENQIRTNLQFQAEVAAGALLNYFKLVIPGHFDNVPKISYRTADDNAAPEFFKMEISLAERIGDAMAAVEREEEPEARAELWAAFVLERALFASELEEEKTRRRLERFEQELFEITMSAFRRIRDRLHDRDAMLLTTDAVGDEAVNRNLLWLESRASMLQLLDSFEPKFAAHDAAIKERLLIAQGPLWDDFTEGAAGIARRERSQRLAIMGVYQQAVGDLVGIDMSLEAFGLREDGEPKTRVEYGRRPNPKTTKEEAAEKQRIVDSAMVLRLHNVVLKTSLDTDIGEGGDSVVAAVRESGSIDALVEAQLDGAEPYSSSLAMRKFAEHAGGNAVVLVPQSDDETTLGGLPLDAARQASFKLTIHPKQAPSLSLVQEVASETTSKKESPPPTAIQSLAMIAEAEGKSTPALAALTESRVDQPSVLESLAMIAEAEGKATPALAALTESRVGQPTVLESLTMIAVSEGKATPALAALTACRVGTESKEPQPEPRKQRTPSLALISESSAKEDVVVTAQWTTIVPPHSGTREVTLVTEDGAEVGTANFIVVQ